MNAKNGTVKRWDEAKGFGFIRSPAVPADVFFRINSFRSQVGLLPCEGMTVVFEEVIVGGKGPRATRVQPVLDTEAVRTTSMQASLQAAAVAVKAEKQLRLVPIKPQRPRRSDHDTFQPANRSQAASTGRHTGVSRQGRAETPSPRLFAYVSLLLLWAALLAVGLITQRLSLWVLPALAALNVMTLFAYAFDKNAAESGRWRTQESTLHLFALAGGWPAARLAQQILRHKNRKESFQSGYWTSAVLHCIALAAWVFGLQDKLVAHLT